MKFAKIYNSKDIGFSVLFMSCASLLHKLFYCLVGRFQTEVPVDLLCTCDKHVLVIRLNIDAFHKPPGKIVDITVVLPVVVLL